MHDHLSPCRRQFFRDNRAGIATLLLVHIAVVCLSMALVARFEYQVIDPNSSYRVYFNPSTFYMGGLVAAGGTLLSIIFIVAKFSFGYFVGFYLFTTTLGYLWLNCYSNLDYDHRRAGLSAAASILAFLVAALHVGTPIKQIYFISDRGLQRVLISILCLSAISICIAGFYNFQVVSLANIYIYRSKLNETPEVLNYLIRITSSSLLPFAFACFLSRKQIWHASASLLLILLCFPIVLTKFSLFSPAWLVFLMFLSQFASARVSVILSLLLPISLGVSAELFAGSSTQLFHLANFRMLAIPSIGLDIYSDFFSRHSVTWFCQIQVLKEIGACPNTEPLSIVMQKAYHLGAFNASLFATEGIASVGSSLAPVSAFVCGLVFALGNNLSARLPSRFILLSGGLIPQILLNVPLTTALLTHGLAFLFALWYVTPISALQEPRADCRAA